MKTVARPLLTESLVLAALCTADMISTLYWVRNGMATEANPIMAIPLAHSDGAFLATKGISYLMPIVILEQLRTLRPKAVQYALRAGIAGYVGVYIVGVLAVAQR